MSRKAYPETPDGRYFVSRGRLWRKGDPSLGDSLRRAALKALMQARLAERRAPDAAARQDARDAVEAAKRRLGESGPVWWTDGAPDESGLHPADSSYRDWWSALDAPARSLGEQDPRGD